MTRSAGRPTARGVVLGICALAVAVLFTAVARQSWTTNTAAAEVVQMEANGAAVLHPMTTAALRTRRGAVGCGPGRTSQPADDSGGT